MIPPPHKVKLKSNGTKGVLSKDKMVTQVTIMEYKWQRTSVNASGTQLSSQELVV